MAPSSSVYVDDLEVFFDMFRQVQGLFSHYYRTLLRLEWHKEYPNLEKEINQVCRVFIFL